jgi:choline dehydrogenase
MPAALACPLAGNRYVSHFASEPEPGLAGRRIAHPRGHVLGGSSSINGMMFVRGHARDFDRWDSEGRAGWSHAGVLPYFRRLESFTNGADAYRGGEGPLMVRRGAVEATPLNAAFVEARRQAGYPESSDCNGGQQEGAGCFDQNIHHGRRWSTATAYLQAAGPAAPLFEFIWPHVYDSPLRRDLVHPEPEIINGTMALPTASGLGIELDRDAVARYRFGPTVS